MESCHVVASEVNAAILGSLFGGPAMVEIMANLRNPMGMRDLVTRVCADTDLGDALWKHDATCASMLSFQQALLAKLGGWVEKCKTDEGYAAVLLAIDELVEDYRSRGVSPMKRQIRLRWMGYEVPLVVIDLGFEAHLRLHTSIKSECLGQAEGVEMMLHETWLGQPRPGTCEWPAKVTRGMKQARKLASSMLQSEKIETLDHVRDALIGGQESLVALDAYFVVEVEFVKTALTDGVAKVVRDTIMSYMPSPKGPEVSLQSCLSSLESFQRSKLGSLCSNASKGEIESTLAILQKMLRGVGPPDALRRSTPFYQEFFHSLQYFLRAVRDENQTQRTLFGADVVKERLAALKSALAKEKDLAKCKDMLLELEQFHAFRYLMSDEQSRIHSELTKELVSRGARSSKKERGKTEVISKKAAKPKEDTHQPGQSESLMSFF